MPHADYIIVGAGSAGCVLAARLSEDPATQVLLVEAGGRDEGDDITVPAGFPRLFKTDRDWQFYTEEQPRLGDRKLYWPRGRMLGGTGSMNAMIYMRGHRSDYDEWAELGNEGWAFDDVLPYFKKSERQERGADEMHGAKGPLWVSDPRYKSPLTEAFVEAAAELGMPRNPDFNGTEQEGVGFFQLTQRRGRRWSTADAFLKPSLGRPNLSVRVNSRAARLLIDGRRIVGVECSDARKTVQLTAAKEVIVCAGAVGSPQLLMLSGLGPADHLMDLEIDPVVDLPGVGRNLQDHVLVPIAYSCTKPVSLAGAQRLGNVLRYALGRRGMLSSNITEAGGFLRSSTALQAPDVEILFGPAYYLDHGFEQVDGHGFTMLPCLLRPSSRGRITLRSADPDAPPSIQPNYLASHVDLDLLVEGLRFCRKLADTRALAPFRGPERVPGESVTDTKDLADYVRSRVDTYYHPVGTCKMGIDAAAVVDSRLRVRHVRSLRVVDASVMPVIPRANTHAPTVMIAEKAADMIKEEAG